MRHESFSSFFPKTGYPQKGVSSWEKGAVHICPQVTSAVSSGWKDNFPCTGADGERRGVGGWAATPLASGWIWQFGCEHDFIWVFPRIMVPQNGWFIMENPIKIWGYPYFWKHPFGLYLWTLHWLNMSIFEETDRSLEGGEEDSF